MIYAIGIVGLVIVALLGALKVQDMRVSAAVAQREAAEQANKSLAASIDGIKRQCTKAIDDARREAERRKGAAKAAAAKADQEASAQRSTIETLIQQARSAKDGAQNCANAEKVLNDLAIDRHR